MKNIVILLVTCTVLLSAMAVGMHTPGVKDATDEKISSQKSDELHQKIPSIGKIQVLNGCGIDGAGKCVADFLRNKKFDVGNDIGNAASSNYQNTIVAARKKDMAIAKQVAEALKTKAVLLMRTRDETYDATVFVGADFQERVR